MAMLLICKRLAQNQILLAHKKAIPFSPMQKRNGFSIATYQVKTLFPVNTQNSVNINIIEFNFTI